jgi:hypothetical protein
MDMTLLSLSCALEPLGKTHDRAAAWERRLDQIEAFYNGRAFRAATAMIRWIGVSIVSLRGSALRPVQV